MTIFFTRAYRLVPRGGAGLACDDEGAALGPMRLVEAVDDGSGQLCYRMRPAAEVGEAFHLAYGSTPDEIQRYQRGLDRIARLLTAGEARKRALTRCCWRSRRSRLKVWRNSEMPRHCETLIPAGPINRATRLAFLGAASGQVIPTTAGRPRM